MTTANRIAIEVTRSVGTVKNWHTANFLTAHGTASCRFLRGFNFGSNRSAGSRFFSLDRLNRFFTVFGFRFFGFFFRNS